MPEAKYGVLKSISFLRSSVIVKFANTRSTFFEVSKAMRFAGLVGSISSFTPSLSASAFA